MSTNVKVIAGVASLALLATGVVVFTTKKDPTPPRTSPKSTSVKPAAPKTSVKIPFKTDQSGRGECVWTKGQQVAYEAHAEIRGFVDMAPLLAQVAKQAKQIKDTKQAVNVVFDWRLEVRALEETKNGETLLAGLFTSYSPGAAAGQGLDKEVVEQLKDLPFLFKMNQRCALVDVARRKSASRAASFLQQTSLKDLQWEYSDQAKKESARYFRQENDAQGTYKVRYIVGAQGDVQEVRRKIIDVLSVRDRTMADGQKADDNTRLEIKGKGSVVTTGKGPWFRSISTDETSTMYVTSSAPLATLRNTKLVRQAPPKESMILESDLDVSGSDWIWGWTLDQPPKQVVMRPELDLARLRAMTPEVALGQYIAMLGDESKNVGAWTEFLKEWIKLHPNELGQLLAAIKSGQVPAKFGHSGIFLALGDSESPAAKKILMSVIQDSKNWSPPHRIMAASSLYNKKELPEDFLSSIQSMANEEDPTARGSGKLLVGAMAKSQQSQNPEVAAEAKQWLGEQAIKASSNEDLKEIFGAISNTSDPDFVKTLKPHTTHKEAEVRAAAIDAMRLMPPKDTAPLFTERMTQEKDLKVRETMASTMESQIEQHKEAPDDVVTVAIAQFQGEQNLTLFSSLTKLLGAAAKLGHQGAQQALQERFKVEMAKNPKQPDFIRVLGPYLREI